MTYNFKRSSGCVAEIAGAIGEHKELVWRLLGSFREK